MKTLVEFVVALFYVNSVTPVVMYYIYDNAQNMGINGVNSDPNFKYGFAGLQMKHFSRHANADKAQTVDLHFKVKKTSSASLAPPSDNLIIRESKEKKKPPQTRTIDKKETKRVNTNRMTSGKEHSNLVFFRMPVSAEYLKLFEQKDKKNCRRKEGSFDNHNFLEVNVHKTQIPTVPQRVKLNNNRQLTGVSVYGPDKYHQKMPTSAVVDKTLQKQSLSLSSVSNRASQIIYRVAGDLKAHVINGLQGPAVSTTVTKRFKRKITYENMRKYVGKDNSADVTKGIMTSENKFTNLQRRSSLETLEIGSLNDITNIKYINTRSPYAYLYRTTPEPVDRNVGDIVPIMSTLKTTAAKHMKHPGKGSDKQKRLSSNESYSIKDGKVGSIKFLANQKKRMVSLLDESFS